MSSVLTILHETDQNTFIDVAIPPLNPDKKVAFDQMLAHTLPEILSEDAPHHDCIYRSLVKRFVEEDVQKMSTERLGGNCIHLTWHMRFTNLFH